MAEFDNKYIVIYRADTQESEIDYHISLLERAGGSVYRRFDSGIIRGYAAIIPDRFLDFLEANLHDEGGIVESISPDGPVSTFGGSSPTPTLG
jgi:hypothetical protein